MADTQLTILKRLLGISLSDTDQDDILECLLENAKNRILEKRWMNYKEDDRDNTLLSSDTYIQLDIAKELYSKMGVEGQLSHNENGIDRSYESADISPSIMKRILTKANTPR
jgi:hypothetical protein